MNKFVAAITGAALLLAAGVATAADVKGAITAVNAQARTITINGVAGVRTITYAP